MGLSGRVVPNIASIPLRAVQRTTQVGSFAGMGRLAALAGMGSYRKWKGRVVRVRALNRTH